MQVVKKIIAVTIFLVMVNFITVTAYADSLSTYKVIRLTLKVVSKSEIKDSYRTIVKRTVENVDKKPVFDITYRGF